MEHNQLIKDIIENFCPRFAPGGRVISIGGVREKLIDIEFQNYEQLGVQIDDLGKMPDLIIVFPEKNWLFLVEAVPNHEPIDFKRQNELKGLFGKGPYSLVFVTAFKSRQAMKKFFVDIAWETEVWVSKEPDHLIHFNGD
jgi:adenine-specific DNA-methyltransferase